MKPMKPTYTTAKVADLKPHPKNPRKHGEAEMKALGESIDRFGFTCPIVVQKSSGLVLAGHARLEVLRKAGTIEVPVIELDVSDADATAYMIADNQLTIMGAWDFPALEELVTGLKAEDYDGMGFLDGLELPEKSDEDWQRQEFSPKDLIPPTVPFWILIRSDSENGPVLVSDILAEHPGVEMHWSKEKL
ncbi:MAG: ParB/Srx family N-terminal domain-containing protein [Patescibacteria group bacterium]